MPLDRGTRSFMEERFGQDFAAIRVHSDAAAAHGAAAVHARAYTLGRHIVFNEGEFAPETNRGRELVAHELAHSVQQGVNNFPESGTEASTLVRHSWHDVAAEREADLMGEFVGRGATVGVQRPTVASRTWSIFPQRQPQSESEDPRTQLDPAVAKRWDALYSSVRGLISDLGQAEAIPPTTVTRKRWLEELGGIWSALDTARSEDEVAALEVRFGQFRKQLYEQTIAGYEGWLDISDRAAAEQITFVGGASIADVYAFQRLTDVYLQTSARMSKLDPDFVVAEDYVQLKYMLEHGTHIWYAERRAARDRASALEQMLEVVGHLRLAGQDDIRLVPGWSERVLEEVKELRFLERETGDRDARDEFALLEKRLIAKWDAAREKHPPTKGALLKTYDLVRGALSAVVDPAVEGAKEIIDLEQIHLFYLSLGRYEPKFISQMGKAAEKGATTSDLLTGMVTGLIDTPVRLYQAILDDDWEAIGRETVNLYFLCKSGPEGVEAASSMLRLIRARRVAGAGWKGGISVEAAFELRRTAMNENLVFEVRPTAAEVVGLRAAGHRPKPGFVKSKTVNEADLYLGMKKADFGKVAYFEPKMPSEFELPNGPFRNTVQERYAQRMQDWQSQKPKIRELIAKGKITLRDSLVCDPETGLAFTSDYDLFDIRIGGMQGPGVEFEHLPPQLREALMRKPLEIQHGAHLDTWDVPASQAENFIEIILAARPRPGAKPLIQFHPDGRITYGYFVD